MARGGDPRVDHRFDPPLAVIGNLRFTRGGVYADYLIDGLPLVLRPLRIRHQAAQGRSGPVLGPQPARGQELELKSALHRP